MEDELSEAGLCTDPFDKLRAVFYHVRVVVHFFKCHFGIATDSVREGEEKGNEERAQ